MSRFLTGMAVLSICVTQLSAQDDDKKEAAKFQGEWKVITAQEGGKDNGGLKTLVLTFKDDKFTIKAGDTREGTFKLDPSTTPRQIEFKLAEEGKVSLGIYQFADADKLMVCVADTGKERPTEFKSAAGARILYLVLARAK